MPDHLTTIIGQQYIRKIKFLGWYSMHFDEKAPYIDHAATPKSWAFDNGTHAERFYFAEGWTYDQETRHFKGAVEFGSPYFGLSSYVYDLTFSEDLTEIAEGIRYGIDTNGKTRDTEPHFTGGLVAYEYIIHHEVKPYVFNLSCQSIRQKSYLDNMDNLIGYYTMEKTSKNNSYDLEPGTMIKLIRDSNETSFQFNMDEKLAFVDI